MTNADAESAPRSAAPRSQSTEVAPWHISLLGSVNVARDGCDLGPFHTHKSEALLARLAMSPGERFERVDIANFLWPDNERGLRCLSTELHRLKRLLADGCDDGAADLPLETSHKHIRLLGDRVAIDVSRFEKAVDAAQTSVDVEAKRAALEDAAACYSGALLQDHDHAEWQGLDIERSRMAQAYVDVLRELAVIAEERGDHSRAIEAAARALRDDPTMGWPYAVLIRANASLGQRADARRWSRIMKAEFESHDLETSQDLRDLADSLLGGIARGVREHVAGDDAEDELERATENHSNLPRGIVAFVVGIIPTARTQAASMLLARACAKSGGHPIDRGSTEVAMAAFNRVLDAIEAAIDALELAGHMKTLANPPQFGVHVGTVEDDDLPAYEVPALQAAERLARAAAPGQALCSQAVAALARPVAATGHWLEQGGTLPLELDVAEPVFTLRFPANMKHAFAAVGEMAQPLLPSRIDSFHGRATEIGAVLKTLEEGRSHLVTLHGPGGIGKTRLAIEIGRTVLRDNGRAAAWVDLGSLTDDASLAPAIARALGAARPGANAEAEAGALLRAQDTLLIIDNAEHLVAKVAQLVGRLATVAPRTWVLITSRRLLGLPFEQPFAVEPLPFDVSGVDRKSQTTKPHEPAASGVVQAGSADNLSTFAPAAALFVERARAAWPRFVLTEQNASAIVQLCAALEGIPLALELAAARAAVLSPSQMLARMDDRFALLRTTRQDLSPRQRSLIATIDTSWELLSTGARRLFARAALFRGGFSIEALEALDAAVPDDEVNAGGSLLDALVELCDAAMLRTGQDGPVLRYRALETLREYGELRLLEMEEEETVAALRDAHADYYLRLGEEAEPELAPGRTQHLWLRLLDDEQDNLRAALRWLEQRGGIGQGLRLSGAVWRYWFERGLLAEGRTQTERFLRHAAGDDRTRARAFAMHAAGTLSDYLGDHAAAAELLEESLAISREIGDATLVSYTVNNLGVLAYRRGDFRKAKDLMLESLAIKRRAGPATRLPHSLLNLARVALNLNERDLFGQAMTEILEVAEETDQPANVAAAHCLRALERAHRGDTDGALAALDLARAAGASEEGRFDAPQIELVRGLSLDWAGKLTEAEKSYRKGITLAINQSNYETEAEIRRFLGQLLLHRGNLEAAERELRAALTIARRNNTGFIATGITICLGLTLVRGGDTAQARPLLAPALEQRAELGPTVALAEALEAWAELLVAEGNQALAITAATTADQLRELHGTPRPTHQRAAAAPAIERARASLPPHSGEAPQSSDGPHGSDWRKVVERLLAS